MLRRMLLSVAGILALSAGSAFAQLLDASPTPPGGLAVANVPVFIVIGSDDDGVDSGVDWIINFLKDKKNPGAAVPVAGAFDSTALHMSFYVNGQYAAVATQAWKRALAAGHEIGNHTYSHIYAANGDPVDGRKESIGYWLHEIQQSDSVVADSLGLTLADMKGFRTPRLEYNDSTFKAIAQRGFQYDCSIEEGNQESLEGYNFNWPHTMDNGNPSDLIQAEWSTGADDWGFRSAGKIPGLWEVPVYPYIVPPNSAAAEYGFTAGIRDSIVKRIDYFDTAMGKITGFDYNLIANLDSMSGCSMDSATFLATLKYTLDQRFTASSNRVPMTLGMHTDYYFPEDMAEDSISYPNITPAQRRSVIENFITYALTKPEVRFITAAELVSWVTAPVGLDGTAGTVIGILSGNTGAAKSGIAINTIANGRLALSVPAAGTYTVSIIAANGATLRSTSVAARAAGSMNVSLGRDLAAGAYVVRVAGAKGLSVTSHLIVE